MRTWLVTGGCGFIGSHLVETLLARGDRVRVLDDLSTGRRENVPARAEVTIGDVADIALLHRLMTGADGCFHLAAVASVQRGNEDWLGTHRTNLSGAIAVFDTARRCRAEAPLPVVYASSAAVYGDHPDMPLSESAPTRPLSAYGCDKLGCELHGAVAWRVHGVPTVGFRFFNVFGPRQDPRSPYSGVIAIFAERIGLGRPIEIHGDGEQVRDFIYVADVVRHLIAAMDGAGAKAEIFNICTGRATSILELARIIGTIAGQTPAIAFKSPRTGDIRISIGDPAKARAAFGFACETLIADGLRLTLAAMTPVR